MQWLKVHPKFLTNSLYVMGDSYSGITVPILVQKISDGNLNKWQPPKNFFILNSYLILQPKITKGPNKWFWWLMEHKKTFKDGNWLCHFVAGNEVGQEPRMNLKVQVQAH